MKPCYTLEMVQSILFINLYRYIRFSRKLLPDFFIFYQKNHRGVSRETVNDITTYRYNNFYLFSEQIRFIIILFIYIYLYVNILPLLLLIKTGFSNNFQVTIKYLSR